MATYTDVQFIGYALPTTPFVTEKILQQASIIAGAGGLVFNCDGQSGGSGTSPQSLWNGCNRAHTQLTQVRTPCGDGPPGQDAIDAELTAPPVRTVTAVSIDVPAPLMLYAYGAGEVFVYSPVPVPRPAGAGLPVEE